MRSSELATFLKCLRKGADETIHQLSRDSRTLGPKDIFFAIKGTGADGHDFLEQICLKGCLGIVVEQMERIPPQFMGWVFQSSNIRQDWALASQRFFGDPSRKLFVTGVTGTNGKTTTTHMIEWISNELGLLTGVIGTIDHHVGPRVWKTSHTTPDSFDLQGRLHDFVSEGAQAATLEVTSHALDQFRTAGVSFDVGVFTNLTRDHLDYHVTMEKYFAAKSRLFQHVLEESGKPDVFAVINQDDPWGQKIRVAPRAKLLRYGRSESVEFSYQVRKMDFSGLEIEVSPRVAHSGSTKILVSFPMMGVFNAENMMAAVGAVFPKLDGRWEDLVKILKGFPGVRGRLQFVPNSRGLFPIVDFAHTDDALKNSLQTIRTVREQSGGNNRIITVFGCGGDRDKGKRPLMGAVAEKLSDVVIVTSDNPRTENPDQIIRDILKGIPKTEIPDRVHTQVDRKRAIELAANLAKPGDVILIAGKGHETDQILGTIKVPFDDVSVVKGVLQ